jgi:polysaccharide export outer membrane protein
MARRRTDILCLLAAAVLTAGLGSSFGAFATENGSSAASRVDVGDVVQVTVFEDPAGIRPGNFVTLPAQSVDCKGVLRMPHAGDIPAAGQTLADIAREIERRLATRAIEPRIAVALIAKRDPGLMSCPI